MAVARSAKETFDFVLEADRALPPEKRTVFHLRRFSTRLALRTQDMTEHQNGQVAELVLRAGIAGWTHLVDEDGAPVECRHDKGKHALFGCEVEAPLSEESLNRLPPTMLAELATAILAGNTLTKHDAKN